MNKSDLAKIAKLLKHAEIEIASGKKMGQMMDERELYDKTPIPSFHPDRPIKSVRVTNTAVTFEQLHPKRWGSFNHSVYKVKK